ncbi:MAG: hypothetical protein U0930_20600 [Pirellulales bacterium]
MIQSRLQHRTKAFETVCGWRRIFRNRLGKNLQHALDVASGAVGLIKTVMQFQKEMIPPLLHYTKPNPNIDFQNSPFYPVTQPKPWGAN